MLFAVPPVKNTSGVVERDEILASPSSLIKPKFVVQTELARSPTLPREMFSLAPAYTWNL
jgi:hypothetical protein